MRELIIGEECGNDIEDDIVISNYPTLEKIRVEKNSMKSINSLTICNNEELKRIEIESAVWYSSGAFYNVKTVIIESNPVKFI